MPPWHSWSPKQRPACFGFYRPRLKLLEDRTLLSLITAPNYPVGDGPQGVAVGDLTGDGISDLVTANWGGSSVSVLLGNGDGTFQARTDYAVGSLADSVAVADLTGDGILDIVTANYGAGTVSVLLGNGDGSFQAH